MCFQIVIKVLQNKSSCNRSKRKGQNTEFNSPLKQGRIEFYHKQTAGYQPFERIKKSWDAHAPAQHI